MRRINAGQVLGVLRTRGAMSRPEIAGATGLSQPTVNGIVGQLVADRLLRELPPGKDARPIRRGPKATLIAFNAAAGHILGVDIGAAQLVLLVADLSGRIVARSHLAIGARDGLRPDQVLARLDIAIASTLSAARLTRQNLMAVGVGVPAIIDPATGRASLVPALPDWDGFALAPRLQPGFDCPVSVHTDVNLACLAEHRLGAAREDKDAVYIHLGVGIGMGILRGGEALAGFDGAAGQIGNLPVDGGDGPPDAGFGQFEWAAGSSAFSRLGRKAALQDGSLILRCAGGDPDAIGPVAVAEAAALGDLAARRIMERQVDCLAKGLASVICVLNPATVVLGGEIAGIGPALIGPLRTRLAALVPRPPRHVIGSFLGGDAIALGAVHVALQDAERRLLPPPAMQAA